MKFTKKLLTRLPKFLYNDCTKYQGVDGMMKIYKAEKNKCESPCLKVTDIETEDVITTSTFSTLITADDILGHGKINFSQIEVDFE